MIFRHDLDFCFVLSFYLLFWLVLLIYLLWFIRWDSPVSFLFICFVEELNIRSEIWTKTTFSFIQMQTLNNSSIRQEYRECFSKVQLSYEISRHWNTCNGFKYIRARRSWKLAMIMHNSLRFVWLNEYLPTLLLGFVRLWNVGQTLYWMTFIKC